MSVTLVDTHDYHTFQPMLYQLATGLLDTQAVAHSLRDLFHDQSNVVVHQARVSAVDLERREARFDDMEPLEYDYLVLALGAEVDFFGVEGAAEHAFPLYSVPDALRLRDHVVRMWERADREPELVTDGALNVVIVGGGPTGVESAGALAELHHYNLAKDYPELPVSEARLVLVEAGDVIFPMFKPDIQSYAQEALEERGVEVILGDAVAKIEPTRVTLRSGTIVPAHTLVWGAGLHANPIVHSLGVELERGARIPVDADLSLSSHPEVFAIGDLAWITDEKEGHTLPQLGSVALQSGEHAGETIARTVAGKHRKSFAYKDKGTMAAIGRDAAVVQLHGGRTIKGKAAWLAWGAVHLALLSTGEDRTKAALDWAWAGFTHERPGRITVDTGAEPAEETIKGGTR